MDIVGIAFDGEMKGYISLKAIKISKWINPGDLSLDVVFRITIEHISGKNGFKKLKRFYMYFKEEDLDNIILKESVIKPEKSKEKELQEKISPLRGFIPRIPTRKVSIVKDRERKRIEVILEDYRVTEKTEKMNVKILLKFNKSVETIDDIEPNAQNPRWFYDCLIEPYLVQTLKWNEEEFMPPADYLEVWLQVPRELYGSLSAVNVQPVGDFEQMFLLGKEIAEEFHKAGQPLAQEDTLCINWSFPNISTSSPPEEIEVTCGMREFEAEDGFVKRFEETPENSILTLREILYTCKAKTLDFKYIMSSISDKNKNLKDVLDIFNTMVFQRYLISMKENLNLLLPVLEHFRDLPYGEDFFSRYSIFHAFVNCEESEDLSYEQLSSTLRHFQELKDILEPDYVELVQDFSDLAELAEKSRYMDDILKRINDLDRKWNRRLMYPDRYILIDILTTWKNIVEKEYEQKVPLPKIEAEMRAKVLEYSDQVGLILSLRFVGSIAFFILSRKIKESSAPKRIGNLKIPLKYRIILSISLVLTVFVICKRFEIMSIFHSFIGSAIFGIISYYVLKSLSVSRKKNGETPESTKT
ncbi:MAG: hypothetical protein AYK19_07985 [Theionarchaea archaeon DG-70-1]|nr:MAG: hypothetical protein AYK19_07985 [Theionarchaea archaeon DG-70-1]